MTFLGSATNEGVKNLGPGAALVSVLPGAVLVLVLVGLVAAGLYPWQHTDDPRLERDGFPALLAVGQGLSVGGAIALVLGVLVVAVLLRPFQIAAVQFLEGYWTSGALNLVEAIATERQQRRRSIAIRRADRASYPYERPASRGFAEVAAWARREADTTRSVRTNRVLAAAYPAEARYVLPTRLGNVLRRAETSAGERYGLDTVATYPRLHSTLGARFEGQISAQLNVLDVAAALTLVSGALVLASSPLAVRPGMDPWRLLPLLFVLVATVSYRGAQRAAVLYGELLLVAYDLHRFDLLRALHRPLPAGPKAERLANAQLTRFLTGSDPAEPPGTLPTGRYEHPSSPPNEAPAAAPPPSGPPRS